MTRKNAQGLTDKQAAFVREYLKDSNATQAAIRAGYAVNAARLSGHNCITNLNVTAALEAERTRLQQDCDWDVAEKKRKLREAHALAIQGNPVLDRYGHLTGKYVTNVSAAIKAIEIMGKFDGELTEKRDTTVRQATADKSRLELEHEQRAIDAALAEHGLGPDGKPLN